MNVQNNPHDLMRIESSVCLVALSLILIAARRRGMKGKDGTIGRVFKKNCLLPHYKEVIPKSEFYVY